MDIKAKIDAAVEKLKKDPALLKKFNDDPTAALEELMGVDLPDELVQKAVDGIKAKLKLEKAGAVLGSLFGK